MYVPTAFKQQDDDTIWSFLHEYSFGTLVSCGRGELVASHIPFEIDTFRNERCLVGHIAAANDQRIDLENGCDMMAVFMGPHAYVSPTWYDHMNVPTWNYAVVHAYGRAEIIHEKSEVMKFLSNMTKRYEANDNESFKTDSLPEKFLNTFLPQIVVFRIIPTKLTAAFKLSQNRNQRDFNNIISELEKRGTDIDRDLARLMSSHKPDHSSV